MRHLIQRFSSAALSLLNSMKLPRQRLRNTAAAKDLEIQIGPIHCWLIASYLRCCATMRRRRTRAQPFHVVMTPVCRRDSAWPGYARPFAPPVDVRVSRLSESIIQPEHARLCGRFFPDPLAPSSPLPPIPRAVAQFTFDALI